MKQYSSLVAIMAQNLVTDIGTIAVFKANLSFLLIILNKVGVKKGKEHF